MWGVAGISLNYSEPNAKERGGERGLCFTGVGGGWGADYCLGYRWEYCARAVPVGVIAKPRTTGERRGGGMMGTKVGDWEARALGSTSEPLPPPADPTDPTDPLNPPAPPPTPPHLQRARRCLTTTGTDPHASWWGERVRARACVCVRVCVLPEGGPPGHARMQHEYPPVPTHLQGHPLEMPRPGNGRNETPFSPPLCLCSARFSFGFGLVLVSTTPPPPPPPLLLLPLLSPLLR